jgi:hypothetical protein
MKSIHNVVTFLAAVVVLSWAGWQTYLHWDIIMKKVAVTPVATKCKPCCNNCKCGKVDCAGACCADKKCCDACGCTDAGCCKK